MIEEQKIFEIVFGQLDNKFRFKTVNFTISNVNPKKGGATASRTLMIKGCLNKNISLDVL